MVWKAWGFYALVVVNILRFRWVNFCRRFLGESERFSGTVQFCQNFKHVGPDNVQFLALYDYLLGDLYSHTPFSPENDIDLTIITGEIKFLILIMMTNFDHDAEFWSWWWILIMMMNFDHDDRSVQPHTKCRSLHSKVNKVSQGMVKNCCRLESFTVSSFKFLLESRFYFVCYWLWKPLRFNIRTGIRPTPNQIPLKNFFSNKDW